MHYYFVDRHLPLSGFDTETPRGTAPKATLPPKEGGDTRSLSRETPSSPPSNQLLLRLREEKIITNWRWDQHTTAQLEPPVAGMCSWPTRGSPSMPVDGTVVSTGRNSESRVFLESMETGRVRSPLSYVDGCVS